MKNIFKLATCLVLFCLSLAVSANDIYLSPSGNNDNDGSTPEKAVASLTKALDLVPATGSGCTIKVSGFIDMSKEIADNAGILWTKKAYFTIEGDSKENSGFDGGNKTRVINFQGFTGEATFKNLTVKNGYSNEGGAIRVLNSTGIVNFEDCIFTSNVSTSTGTLHIYRSTGNIWNCEFRNNKAPKGGGVHAGVDSKVNMKFCLIENNDLTTVASSSGGGIYINITNGFSADQCIVRNNKALLQGGGITINNTTAANSNIVKITNSLIANNESTTSGGGGIFINDGTAAYSLQVQVVNTTIYGNTASAYGGAVFVSGGQTGSSVQLVNNTIVENKTKGNAGHGPGISFRDSKNLKRYVYNCIIEDNSATTGGLYADITTNYDYNSEGDDFFLRNSFVGSFSGSATYTDQVLFNNTLNYGTTQAAGLAKPYAGYIASQNSIPLTDNSDAITKADAQYLKDLKVYTDQSGKIRTFTDEKCAAGAVDPSLSDKEYVDLYQHFIMYGQSLSAGEQSYPPLSVDNVEGNYMIGSQVWINYGHPAADLVKFNPLVANIAGSKATTDLNYNSIGDNPVVGAVNHIQLKTKGTEYASKMLATSCGTGGTAIEQLSKSTGTLYGNQALLAMNSAATIAGQSMTKIVCPAIFWMQGESNCVANTNGYTTSKDEYKALMVQLKNDMQNDAVSKYRQAEKPVFITYQTSGQFLRNFYDLPIAMAQLEASNEYDDIICAGPVYPGTLPTSGAHLNSNGYRWYGEMLGKVYYKTQILKEEFKPLHPIGYYSTDNQDEIKIQFHVPYPPLVLDERLIAKRTGNGFEVKLNNAKVTVSKVTIAGDCVALKLSKKIAQTDAIEISYAGIDIQSGNLRDSDPYSAFYKYEDLDKKTGSGDFYYPRLNNLTLRPREEPKNAAGQVIYDQPYPLYNFCVAFYKKIDAGGLHSDVGISQVKKADSPFAYVYDSCLFIDAKSNQVNKVELFDVSGLKVKEFADNQAKYPIDTLPDGLYITRISTSEGVYTAKMVK
ncbi:sialate O-acetylesterase [Viscerimonas tarda]